jgi:hypothetical protein
VIHECTEDFTTTFLVLVGPFLVNSVLCFAICLPAFVPLRVFGQSDPVSYLLIWVGVSIGMHAFPSLGDAGILCRETWVAAKSLHPLALISSPFAIAIYIASLVSIIGFDYAYGVALGYGLPALLLKWPV